MKIDLSFVIPVHNEEGTLRELEDLIRCSVPEGKNIEMIFIDDGSTDSSGQILDDLVATKPGIKVVHFQSNYGKGAALACGFREAVGDIVFTIDADLQDSPTEIPRFLEKVDEGKLDLVGGWRKVRRDSTVKRVSSRLFNFVVRRLSGIPLHDFNCGFKCYRRRVIREIPMYGGMHRFTPLLARSHGFTRIGEIMVEHNPRRSGKTKYGIERLFSASMDLVTVLFLERFVRRPMRFFGWLGLALLLMGGVVFLFEIVTWALGGEYNIHIALMAALLGFASAVICVGIGLIGELLVRHTVDPSQQYVIDRIEMSENRPVE